MKATFERAYYSPLGQYIYLSRYDKKDSDKLMKTHISENNLSDKQALIHEFRHWLDHVSSNYGQEYLLTNFEFLDLAMRREPYIVSPINPLIVDKCLRENNLIHICFSQTIERDDPNLIWNKRLNHSTLNRVSFTIIEFYTPQGKLVCQTPITYLSLFETNAVFEELHLYYHFSTQSYKDNPNKEFYDLIEFRKYATRSYSSDLIEYNVATHLIAMIFKIPSVLNAFDVATKICTLLLNLTKKQYRKLSDKVTKYHTRHDHYFRNRDFGYILYAICFDYKKIQHRIPRFNLDEFLNFFDLPDETNFLY